MPKRPSECSNLPPATRRGTILRRGPSHTRHTVFLDLPEDAQEHVFRSICPDGILSQKALSDAPFLLALRDQLPTVNGAFRYITVIDGRPPIPSSYACVIPSLMTNNLLQIIRMSISLRAVRLPSIPAQNFIPHLPHNLEELDYTDCLKSDINPLIPGLKTLTIHDPRPETVRNLRKHGDCIQNISFESVRSHVMKEVEEFLLNRSQQLVSISLMLQLEYHSPGLRTVTEVLADFLAKFMQRQGDLFFPDLLHLRLGPASTTKSLERLIPANVRDRIAICVETITGGLQDFSGTAHPRRMGFTRRQLLQAGWSPEKAAYIKEVVVNVYDELIFGAVMRLIYPDEVSKKGLHAILESPVPYTEVFKPFLSLELLSVRVPFAQYLYGMKLNVLIVSWILQGLQQLITLEVPRDFVMVPGCIGDGSRLWDPFQGVRTLVLTNKIRPTSFEEVDGPSLIVDNDVFLEALPNFLSFVGTSCRNTTCVHLESCGHMTRCGDKLRGVTRKIALRAAISALDKLQRDNKTIDISSIRAQIQQWQDQHEADTRSLAGNIVLST